MGKKVELLKILVMGITSTGKTYLIKVIREQLHRMAEMKRKSSILMIASIGVIAFNINKSTIHLMLFISIFKEKIDDLNRKKLK